MCAKFGTIVITNNDLARGVRDIWITIQSHCLSFAPRMFLLPEMCTPCFCIVALHGYELMLNFKLFKLLKVVSTPSSAGHYVHFSLQTQLTFLFVLCFFSWKYFIHPFMCFIIYLVRYYLYIEARHGSWNTTSKRY